MFVLILRVCRGMKGALREKVNWAQQKGSRLYCSVGGAGLVPTTSISTTTPYTGLEGEMERGPGGENNVGICHNGSVCSSYQFGGEARSRIWLHLSVFTVLRLYHSTLHLARNLKSLGYNFPAHILATAHLHSISSTQNVSPFYWK